MPVVKSNGAVRLSGDFKVTVNSYANMQPYFLHPEKHRAVVSGGILFSKVDYADAYLKKEIDKESLNYLVLSTQKSFSVIHFLYRLLFGFSRDPAIF